MVISLDEDVGVADASVVMGGGLEPEDRPPTIKAVPAEELITEADEDADTIAELALGSALDTALLVEEAREAAMLEAEEAMEDASLVADDAMLEASLVRDDTTLDVLSEPEG